MEQKELEVRLLFLFTVQSTEKKNTKNGNKIQRETFSSLVF